MNALVIKENGKIELQRRDKPIPLEGEVLVKIHACGLCSSDRARAFFQGAYHYPLVAGHEMSGEVVGVGPGVPEHYFGKRVTVFPLLPCRQCDACKQSYYAMCSNYDYYGSRRDGAFQEYLTVPLFNIVFLSDELPYDIAALSEPAAVAVHAVKLSGASKQQTVAIVGTGTIAILAALYCRFLGIEHVYIYGRSQDKVDWLNREIHLSAFTIGERLSGNDIIGSVDVILECVGSRESLLSSIQLASHRASIVLLGNPEGDVDIPREIYWRLLRKEICLQGSWNSSYADTNNDWLEAIKFLGEYQALVSCIITEKFTLEQGEEAFKRLRENRKVFGKLMIIFEHTEGGME